MRIVGGRLAGRDLYGPRDPRVRPTAEPVRGALLDHLAGEITGARVLDLFAGTGALGLEAISRGAATADFVEWRPTSLHALKSNITSLKLRDRTRIFRKDAIRFAEALTADRYDVAFADPPYESRQLDWVIRLWHELAFSRVLAVEHASTHPLPPGTATLDFGPTRATIYRRPVGPVTAAEPPATTTPSPKPSRRA